MLNKDLIRFRRRKDRLVPSFIDVTDWRYLKLAQNLLSVYQNGIGMPRETLEEQTTMMVNSFRDVKLAKGLNKLCLDRSEYEKPGKYDYPELRKRLFKRAGELLQSETLEDYHSYQLEVFRQSEDEVTFVQSEIYGDLPANEESVSYTHLTLPTT